MTPTEKSPDSFDYRGFGGMTVQELINELSKSSHRNDIVTVSSLGIDCGEVSKAWQSSDRVVLECFICEHPEITTCDENGNTNYPVNPNKPMFAKCVKCGMGTFKGDIL